MNNLEKAYKRVNSIGQFSREYFSYLSKVLESIDQNEIDKFAFSTDSTSTDVGNLHTGGRAGAGTSSLTYGYLSGGEAPNVSNTKTIRKYSFESDGDSVATGADLTVERHANSGASSETFGYSAAGFWAPYGGALNIIEKFIIILLSDDLNECTNINKVIIPKDELVAILSMPPTCA